MKSTVTNLEGYCFFCGGYSSGEHHLIFGTSGRAFAEKYGLKVPICDRCHTQSEYLCDRIHDNSMAEKLSKMLGQAIFERNMMSQGMSQNEARERILSEHGRSYL